MKENELLRNDFRFHVGSNEDIAVALKKSVFFFGSYTCLALFKQTK